ncbi:hypothetical protein F5Y16DRAFT_411718 [Xylariaceae sp. FL0255]|nr:hypothetical protein F5Y16DRAFT_411718 [Xylariaceae sp. FL0255]
METQPSSAPPVRTITSYACEACRSAKTRCQPGPQPGICKRCSEFKRECVFRTGPRTRRSKAARIAAESATLPPVPGPSKTFSINFNMPVTKDPADDFEALRIQHERFLEDIMPEDDVGEGANEGGQAEGYATASSHQKVKQIFDFNDLSASAEHLPASGTCDTFSQTSSTKSRSQQQHAVKPVHDMGIKPQFNLDSATRLLCSFRDMLPHMPCLVLDDLLPDPSADEATSENVRALARDRPFVLLAILAVTSCSSSLQGYSLYDEEFRKVLGLKFVAGGERSIELLQGLLIYCCWYPFHLRPKNQQLFQYLRMAVDIVHDLELEESDLDLAAMAPEERTQSLEGLRALLGCFYAISTFSSIWSKKSSLRYSPQLAQCVDALELYSNLEQDHILVWLVRMQYIFEELDQVWRTYDGGFHDATSAMHRDLIIVGLETQFSDFQARMPERYASFPSIRQLVLLTQTMTLIPGIRQLWRKPSRYGSKPGAQPKPPIPNSAMQQAAVCVRSFFEGILALCRQKLGDFCGTDYSRLIVATILGFRMSLPLTAISPDYDVVAGRQIIEFGEILQRFCAIDDNLEQSSSDRDDDVIAPGAGATRSGKGKEKDAASGGQTPKTDAKPPKPQSKRIDAVAAFIVVLRSLKSKYDEKSKAFEERIARDFRIGCPVMNGTLDQYVPLWSGKQHLQPQQELHDSHALGNSMPPNMTFGGIQYANMPNGDVLEMDMSSMGATVASSSYATSQTSSSGIDALSGGPAVFSENMAVNPAAGAEDKPTLFHDLWATMTMGWAGDDIRPINLQDPDVMNYDDFDTGL